MVLVLYTAPQLQRNRERDEHTLLMADRVCTCYPEPMIMAHMAHMDNKLSSYRISPRSSVDIYWSSVRVPPQLL